MRSEHSDADRVPVRRCANQLFENACMLSKILSWFSQKRWALSRNVVEISGFGRNAFCIMDVHSSPTFVVVMLCLLESRLRPVISEGQVCAQTLTLVSQKVPSIARSCCRRFRIFDLDPDSRRPRAIERIQLL